MKTEEMVHILGAKGRSPRWRAVCPLHGGKTLTLALYAGKERMTLRCFAGCDSDAILAHYRLKWKDLLYESRRTMTREQSKAWSLKKQQRRDMKQLELRWSIALWAQWAFPRHRSAWAFMERMYWRAMKHLDLEMSPERKRKYDLLRAYRLQGADASWAMLENSPQWDGMMQEASR